MLKRGILAVAIAAGILGFVPTAAQAIPPGDNLIVFAYFDGPDQNNRHLVGQKWHGCKQPSGSWGVQTGYFEMHFPPCGPDAAVAR